MAHTKSYVCLIAALIGSSFIPTKGEDSDRFYLPEITISEQGSVDDAIYKRQSVRQFAETPVTMEQISKLFWAAGGKTVDGVTGATRAYPSAGGLYPLKFYVVVKGVSGLEDGVYNYDWQTHSVANKKLGDRINRVKEATYSSAFVNQYVSAVFIITANFSVTAAKYSQRGERRYVPMEAGASSQNMALKAQTLGLGSYPIGAFNDKALCNALELGEHEKPLLVIPVGNVK